jgi:hypothetical protein
MSSPLHSNPLLQQRFLLTEVRQLVQKLSAMALRVAALAQELARRLAYSQPQQWAIGDWQAAARPLEPRHPNRDQCGRKIRVDARAHNPQ